MNTKPTAPWPILKRPLVAILRGIQPGEAADIGAALVEAGFEAIEVPLNSPDPFRSIETLVSNFGSHCMIGAGTVLTADDVTKLADVGGKLLVSPNIDPSVMEKAAERGLITMPGVLTPTEAITAVALGASALKFFPASNIGPEGIAAIKAVLPADTIVGAVGGVGNQSFKHYLAAGVQAFGLGSSLYTPGQSAADVSQRAREAVEMFDVAKGERAT
ncbi:MAG: 2-dehydro-3-deoxy-6-phosphogalactonate aldolase [Pseudomonadota bacterium]